MMNRKISLQICLFVFLGAFAITLSACWNADDQGAITPSTNAASESANTLEINTESNTENLADSFEESASPTPRPTLPATVVPTPTPFSIDDVYQKLKSSTVYVYANTVDGASTGSGIIYSPDGLIVTNAHVVQKAVNVRVYLEGAESSVAAKVIGISYCDDLAVLDIDGDGFEPVTFGDSGALKRGQEVVALGYPLSRELGVDLTVTSGQVNRLNAQVENLENVIQTDASINPGNSGGPLANLYGEVVGINTSRINATNEGQRVTGVSFAIASNFAIPILTQLEKGRNLYWTGLDFQFNEEQNRLVVANVDNGSPADAIGIMKGDVLISIDNHSFRTQYEACRLIKNAGYEDHGVAIDLMRGQYKLTGELGKTTLSASAAIVAQEVVSMPELSETEIAKRVRQYNFVTDIAYDENWRVLLSKNIGFNDQRLRIVDSPSKLEEMLDTSLKEGYYITDLAYGNSDWVAILSAGTSYIEQRIVHGRLFPIDEVEMLQAEDYAITSAASSNGHWVIVMSTGNKFIDQQYEFIDHDDLSSRLSELSSINQYVTHIVSSDRWVGDTWFVVHSELQTHSRQRNIITPVVSDDVIDTILGGNTPTIDAMQTLHGEWVILYR